MLDNVAVGEHSRFLETDDVDEERIRASAS